ncbi:hypothetical protein KNT86_gp229 [Enterobacteria phage vB_EcoM_IME341]|uniref:Uncharacterized protein n=1 Tax=Enterobacteria phage vB_EcoM_IME341 TaxID=2163891 RepID=A0A2S1GS35_9CAUD|nr:hypothetical protein KNT86_gp229 [Enterobacteria phage vB_EcoM_IME341]AWD92156.1 hypothetical protein [Enterobacteria phage vB_EcoM_IME341]
MIHEIETCERLKEVYGLSTTQTVFDLSEELQIEFQKDLQKLLHPGQQVFQAMIKTKDEDGNSTIKRQTIEI